MPQSGRRSRDNQSCGTNHGTANVHLVAGGRVKGGLYGEQPSLARLDGNGKVSHSVDFRRVYASVLERWWGVSSQNALRGASPRSTFCGPSLRLATPA